MARTEFYNGIPYRIELAWSNPWYGRKRLYKIFTDEENFCVAKAAVCSYLNTDNKPSKGLYDLKKDRGQQTLGDYIKGFFKFSWNEQDNCYEYYEEEGYDD